ncbi:bifunctional UDP-N-acetylmuramoyl-tripeptide:D-alanyl-D-alanine ligase/alanine racemase [Fulvivirgaceae bacterium BMA10]|uniref:Alanine racemase n=1 Tax=Splendidivirga corallicola TaxID=3051826 RepID=A0ABT8KLM6_9BACT|nr:bifunctional UDP-N-acetylmuramoyl-tripeptide:D-alanyl-D-alanine ligase/alanine racemase [Fulvivirgaceae bacterium BMA10]
MFLFTRLGTITKGKILKLHKDQEVSQFLTDSRKVSIFPEALFVAIKGERHDGHQFIAKLYQLGIRQFMVESETSHQYDQFGDCNILKVDNCIAALQAIAANHRLKFSLPVLAITGSNGKTIVKEWLSQILSARLKVVKSPKSYNSQLGVPLSVLQMEEGHDLAIFEAGISRKGEMKNLKQVIHPNIGIFTNIGPAHDQGFSSTKEKIIEKALLFEQVNTIIYCRDYEDIDEVLRELYDDKKLFSWSRRHNANIQVIKSFRTEGFTEITLLFNSQHLFFRVPMLDEANLENAIFCICASLYFNINKNTIQKGLDQLKPVSMRLELKEGINGCYIIDDTYNNDLAGLQQALDFLSQQKQREKKAVILSDILDSGGSSKALYQKVSKLIQVNSIQRLIGIGPAIQANEDLFQEGSHFFKDVEDFIDHFDELNFTNEIILVKGARKFSFENITAKLQRKIHGTVLEIDLDAITHNLNFYRSKLKSNTKLMVMVKALAYGSGSHEIANLLQFHRVDYLGVAYADEGVSLRQHGIEIPIMVMNPSPDSFDKIIGHHLEPEIYNLHILKEFVSHLQKTKAQCKIHIKLESGMNRLGFEPDDLPELIEILSENSQIQVASIFSHLAGSDEAKHNDYSREQANRFIEGAELLKSGLKIKPICHLLNSPGILRFPEYHFDMVRLGIGLHGIDVNQQSQSELENVATLKTTISQIRKIKKGDTVGYGRAGVAPKEIKIATIAIGYADGYDRRFSKGVGKVVVSGKLAPVIGNVCMDMTMVDITGLQAKEGDEVIVFGKERSILELASDIGTIPYEILTNVSERVKRVFYTA